MLISIVIAPSDGIVSVSTRAHAVAGLRIPIRKEWPGMDIPNMGG
jgi:hypothetical protein